MDEGMSSAGQTKAQVYTKKAPTFFFFLIFLTCLLAKRTLAVTSNASLATGASRVHVKNEVDYWTGGRGVGREV